MRNKRFPKNPETTTVHIYRADAKRLRLHQRPGELLRDVVKRALDALEMIEVEDDDDEEKEKV